MYAALGLWGRVGSRALGPALLDSGKAVPEPSITEFPSQCSPACLGRTRKGLSVQPPGGPRRGPRQVGQVGLGWHWLGGEWGVREFSEEVYRLHLETGHAAQDRAGWGAGLEIALRYTLTGARRCGLTHEYAQPCRQPRLQTWVCSWGRKPRTAAAFLPINPSLVSHRSRLGGAWEKEVWT